MRILLVSNDSASSVTARTRVLVRRALADAGHDVSEATTARRGNATAIATGAVHDGIDIVVGFGGDGTVNELANGLIGSETALAVLPGGSTNVFSRAIGTPDDPMIAVRHVLAGLDAAMIRRVGLGTVNGRVFTFHTGLGFDAGVVDRVERRGRLKRYASHPLFAAAAVAEWWQLDRDTPLLHIELPDGEVIDDAFFAVVLNLNPYTYVGSRPLNLAPDAGLDRPLVLVALRSLGARTVAPLILSALSSGRRLRRHRHVAYRTDLSSLTIRGNAPVAHQVDGDPLSPALTLLFDHRPRSMNLVMPTPPG